MIDQLGKERTALEKQNYINALEYALKWETLSRKYEAEGCVAGKEICLFRARHYAALHAATQNAAMN